MRKNRRIVLAVISLLVLFFAFQGRSFPVNANEIKIVHETKSKGNLIFSREAIEFYSEDVQNLSDSMDELMELLQKGKVLIVESLEVRNVPINGDILFTDMPEAIIAVEQRVYLGEQKVPARIEYLYHNHTYQGNSTNDQLSEMIVPQPEGCYTKEVYNESGKSKGYTVGCGFVERQIIGADIIEIN